LFAVYFSDLIPKSALAAMLIGVGWKLAHPREFGSMIKIGTDQFLIFVVTIIFTLATDLLIGIAAGILVKLIMHLIYGVPAKSLFNAQTIVKESGLEVRGAVVFSNFIKVKNLLNKFPKTEEIFLDVRNCKLIDHSVIESIHHLKDEFKEEGGALTVIGIEEFKNMNRSKHELATKRKK
jgi:MFS superfamily sulfate permease-like transporter